MICPSCGNNTPDSAKFCSRCGREMPAAKPPEASVNGMTAMLEPGGGGDSLFDKIFNPRIINTQNPNSPRPIAKSQYLFVWSAMFVALFIYIGPWFLITSGNAQRAAPNVPHIMLPVISVIAAVLWCVGLLLAYQALSPNRLKYSKDKEQLRANIAMFGIIGMALVEATAIMGVVLVILKFDRFIFFPFMIMAAIGMLLHLLFAIKAWKFHDALPDS